MKQASFTAKELFGMAYLTKKPKMYGIPNATGLEHNFVLQAVLDSLVSQNIADMDIDGQITLRPEYFATVSTYCDCQKCLTVNMRAEDKTERSYIFWLQDDECTMAEVAGNLYVFSSIDAAMVEAMVGQLLCSAEVRELTSEVVIPQLALVKAKRACVKGDYVEAIRIIRQGGATSNISNVILSGIQGNAYYMGLVYMAMQTGECQKQDLSYIYKEGVLLSLGQTIANLRTCATFTPIKCEDMHSAVNVLIHSFLEKKE